MIYLKTGKFSEKRYENCLPSEHLYVSTGKYTLYTKEKVLKAARNLYQADISIEKANYLTFYKELRVKNETKVYLFLDRRGYFLRNDEEIARSSIETLFQEVER